ncbi:RHS repeat domain-containing protein, partial [Flammeovirga aprica]
HVLSYSDYYPFGLKITARSSGSEEYRYGFNGMEHEEDIAGYSTEFRQYNPVIGRFLSIDPEWTLQPDISPYVGLNDNPILFKDTKGDFVVIGTSIGVYYAVAGAVVLGTITIWHVKRMIDKGMFGSLFRGKPSIRIHPVIPIMPNVQPDRKKPLAPKPNPGIPVALTPRPEDWDDMDIDQKIGWLEENGDPEDEDDVRILKELKEIRKWPAIWAEKFKKVKNKNNKSVEPGIPIIDQLKGKGQLEDLRNNGNIKGIDLEKLIELTPEELDKELGDSKSGKKMKRLIYKAFEKRDLGNKGRKN